MYAASAAYMRPPFYFLLFLRFPLKNDLLERRQDNFIHGNRFFAGGFSWLQ